MIRKQNTQNKFAKGFTLLELLVVIVIIGILAAIALPQYQLAKDKADFAKYQSMVASIIDAYDEYVLAHNEGTSHFEDLSFSLPSTFQDYTSSSYSIKCKADNSMWCCMREYKYESEENYWSASIFCGKKDKEDSLIYNQYLYSPKGDTKRDRYCLAYVENKKANRLCNTIGSDKKRVTFATPLRRDKNYYRYKISK